MLQPNQKFNLTLYALDSGNPQMSSTTTIDIFVHPSPDNVRFTSPHYHYTIPEDEPRGSLIGQVEAFVIDDSNTTNTELQVAYTLSTQLSPSIFSIRNTSGEIYLVHDLDYDLSAHQHTLNIQARYQDTSGITLVNEASVMINVLNVNDNPPQFTPGFYATVIRESTPAGTSILTVLAIDTDEEEDIVYSLEGDDSDPFMIDPQTGGISTRNNLTVAQDHHFHVVASDGKHTSQAVVHISVSRQVSVKPTFTKEQYIFNISENLYETQIYIGRVEALSFGRRYSREFPSVKFRLSRPDPLGLSSSMTSESELEINGTTGMISTVAGIEFDAESQENHVLC